MLYFCFYYYKNYNYNLIFDFIQYNLNLVVSKHNYY